MGDCIYRKNIWYDKKEVDMRGVCIVILVGFMGLGGCQFGKRTRISPRVQRVMDRQRDARLAGRNEGVEAANGQVATGQVVEAGRKPAVIKASGGKLGGLNDVSGGADVASVVGDIRGTLGVDRGQLLAGEDAGDAEVKKAFAVVEGGHAGIDRELTYRYFERFDAEIYTKGHKHVNLERVKEHYWEATSKPWTARSKPFVAQWLNGNRGFIEGFKLASKRKVLWGGGELRADDLAGVRVIGQLGLVSHVLAIDGYFFMGRGEWKRAMTGIDAMKRIGRLMMEGKDMAVWRAGDQIVQMAKTMEADMKRLRERSE